MPGSLFSCSSSQVASSNYFTFFTQDNKNTIFVAPNASDGAGPGAART